MRDENLAESLPDLVDRSVLVPLIEEVPYRGPWPELLREITPGRARPQNPEDRINDLAAVPRPPSGLAVARGEQVSDDFPLPIAERMSKMTRSWHCSL